jgi:hypothetical protein
MQAAQRPWPVGGMIAMEPAETTTLLQPADRSEHAADRSSWDCRACGEPWPCAPAKVTLNEDFWDRRSTLIVFLVSTFYAAVDSYADREAPPDLYGRFVMWAVKAVNP